MGGRLRRLDELIGAIRNAEALGWNLYLNLNPTRNVPGKKKLCREDVTHWRYVLVDLDPGEGALVPPSPRFSADGGPYRPDTLLLYSHHIFTGSGYHYWMPLPPNVWAGTQEFSGMWVECKGNSTEEYKLMAERIMRGYLAALAETSAAWAPGWIVDVQCSDLPRVVRCPGSVNQKTGKRAVVERTYGGCPLDMNLLMQYNTPPTPPDCLWADIDCSNLLQVLPHLNVRARTFILEGAISPGRHSACYATAKNLNELGVTRDRALEWLLIGAAKCSEQYSFITSDLNQEPGKQQLWEQWSRAKELDQPEVERIVKQVWG